MQIANIDKSKNFRIWEKDINVPLIYIEDLIINQANIFRNPDDTLYLASSTYANIMIEKNRSENTQIPDNYIVSREKIEEMTNTIRTDVDLIRVSISKLYNLEPNPKFYEHSLEQILTHEIGHIIDSQDKDFVKAFTDYKKIYTQPSKYNSEKDYQIFHSELNAVLSEMRFTMGGYHLNNLITAYFNDSLSEDVKSKLNVYDHVYGYLSKKIVANILNNPQKYHFNVEKSRLLPESQILLQFGRFIKDQTTWNVLVEEIKQDHINIYHEYDFGYLVSLGAISLGATALIKLEEFLRNRKNEQKNAKKVKRKK